MKFRISKGLGLLAVLALFVSVGCVTTVGKPPTIPPQEVIVKVQTENGATIKDSASEDKINKTMQIPYEGAEFPSDVTLIGDTVYYTLWSTISTPDALNIWRTIQIMKARGLSKIHIYINSGGGSAFAGMAFSDTLISAISDGFEVTTEASGIVASAAVPIFVVGQKRTASKGTLFMIHEGTLFKFLSSETKGDLASQQKMMELLDDRYNAILAKHGKITVEEIKDMVAKTTWFTAEEAMDMGFVDEVK